MEGEPAEDATLFPTTVGEKLRGARLAQGLDIAEIAARTRVPQRHLEAIEASNYSSLPSQTYAMGFARAYARAVGADEVAIARDLRAELNERYEPRAIHMPYETTDPTRVPPRGIAWIGAIIAVLIVVGVGLFYGTTLFRGEAPPAEPLINAEATATPAPQPSPTPTPVAGGQVTLTALDTVWLRVTDAGGNQLVQKELQPGETFDIPAGADHPKARTARPEKIRVTINGSEVAPLGPAGKAVDVEVSAAALQARGTAVPGATPAADAATASPRSTIRVAPATPAAPPAFATPAPNDATGGNATTP